MELSLGGGFCLFGFSSDLFLKLAAGTGHVMSPSSSLAA